MLTITIDLEFAEKNGVIEALFLSILRRFELENYPMRMFTHTNIQRMYPMYNRETYRKAMKDLESKGYITVEERRLYRGKYKHCICRLTDKAFKEYRFVE